MNAIKNTVQLIGHTGMDPEIKTFEGGKKVASISLATNESYKNDKGEKVEQTEWHRVVAWGKVAEIIEKYVTKGKEIVVQGKLTYRSYEDKNGEKRYITEIVANDILLLGK
jgi:single-strand DNA-binding protein